MAVLAHPKVVAAHVSTEKPDIYLGCLGSAAFGSHPEGRSAAVPPRQADYLQAGQRSIELGCPAERGQARPDHPREPGLLRRPIGAGHTGLRTCPEGGRDRAAGVRQAQLRGWHLHHQTTCACASWRSTHWSAAATRARCARGATHPGLPQPAGPEAWVAQAAALRSSRRVPTWRSPSSKNDQASTGHQPTLDLVASYNRAGNPSGSALAPRSNNAQLSEWFKISGRAESGIPQDLGGIC